MVDNSVKLVNFPVANGMAGTDSVVALVSNGTVSNSSLVSATNLLGNTGASHVVVNGYSLIVANSFTPANSTATGVRGTIAWDSSFLYIATSTNTWKRVALTSF